jgi:hypothetical protein
MNEREYGELEFDDENDDENDGSDEIADSDAQELALELLQVQDEEELDEFLGSLLKSAARAGGRFLRSGVGQKLIGAAKNLAKRHLPSLAANIGGHFGGDVGRNIGGKVGKFAASQLEVDDSELETAKTLVKAMVSAGKTASAADASTPAAWVAKSALTQALKREGGIGGARPGGSKQSQGQWVRRGTRIVLLGVT